MAQAGGVLEVRSNEPREINDVFRRIRDELDTLQGLRGSASFFDQKTLIHVALRFVDGDGTLLHAWGAKT
jgi:hypothetical protein